MAHDQNRLSAPGTLFDVDGMLGRLAKWLRIAGFDAAYPRTRPVPGRWFVTTKRWMLSPGTIVVADRDPVGQLRAVLAEAGADLDPGRFFSRCLICKVPVEAVPKAGVRAVVPAPIYLATEEFHRCPVCLRIYWDGSHLDRIRRRLGGVGKLRA